MIPSSRWPVDFGNPSGCSSVHRLRGASKLRETLETVRSLGSWKSTSSPPLAFLWQCVRCGPGLQRWPRGPRRNWNTAHPSYGSHGTLTRCSSVPSPLPSAYLKASRMAPCWGANDHSVYSLWWMSGATLLVWTPWFSCLCQMSCHREFQKCVLY